MASLFLCAGDVFAQSAEKESAAVLELGGAGAWSLTEGQSSFGPAAAVEVTPIENRLELEAGVTPLFRRHSTEWSIDLLFKRPWRGSGAGLHVLVIQEASIRVVSRTELRL